MSIQSDSTLFASIRAELYSAVVGDIMDLLGYQHQFLPPQIQPLSTDMVVIGRAMPVQIENIDQDAAKESKSEEDERPFGLMLRALDDLQAGEVYLCTGAAPTYALWGELMSLAARNRGAAGAVLDGWARDTRSIIEMVFPCFAYGRHAQDQRPRGRVIDFRCRVRIGRVEIAPGDLVVGDCDGVCVVPRGIEEEVLARAFEKARGEKKVYQAIKSGMGAQQAWDQFGIL